MNNQNENFKSWGILLGGVGLLLCGFGAISHVFHEFRMSRVFVRHMENMPLQVVSDIMSTNGPDQICIEDDAGRPWITFENKDKTKAEFYRINETNKPICRDVVSFLNSISQESDIPDDSKTEESEPKHAR